MIDVNNLIQKHLYITKDEEQDVHTSQESVKDLLRDFGILLLQKAADKAHLSLNTYVNCDFTKEEGDYGQELATYREDEYWTVSKSSITSIINDINFD